MLDTAPHKDRYGKTLKPVRHVPLLQGVTKVALDASAKVLWFVKGKRIFRLAIDRAFTLDALEEFCGSVDVVVVSVPFTDQTRGIVSPHLTVQHIKQLVEVFSPLC